MNIGLLDSGIGGLNCLNSIIKNFGNNNFIYYCDSLNMPYGNKTDEEIKKIVLYGINELIKRSCEIIILACNTATTVVLSTIKKDFKNIIGVTPPINEAINDGNNKILLLATPATIRSLEKAIKNNDRIIAEPLDSLASLIEQNSDNLENIKPFLESIINKYSNIDSIIIGCTHYLFINKLLSEIKPNLRLYDGNDNMIKKIKSIIKDKQKPINFLNQSNITIIDSQKNSSQRYRNYIKIIKILLNMDIKANIELL